MSKLRDWWRGYSDEDIRTAREKLEKLLHDRYPGSWIEVTKKERRAFLGENMWTDYAVDKYKGD